MTPRRVSGAWVVALAVALPGAVLVASPGQGGGSGTAADPLVAPDTSVGAPVDTTSVAVHSLPSAERQEQGFPHERHAGLFPLCAGCHSGVLSGDPSEVFPTRALCVRCHDGADQKSVAWEAPTPRPDNLAFDHAQHARGLARAGDPEPGCEGCHATSPEQRMRVALPDPAARCLTCHQHAAPDHLVSAACSTCHVPLAGSGFSVAQIEALPKPTDHDDPAFLLRVHGDAAAASPTRCATCHVQQRCTACHVDAEQPVLRRIPAAAASMALPTFGARYEAPATHRAPEWTEAHGATASRSACATCHAREDCAVCHRSALPEAAASLPERAHSRAPGAQIRQRAPDSHADPFFYAAHGSAAAAKGNACATCHSGGFCAECHRLGGAIQAAGLPAGESPALLALLRFQPAGGHPGVRAPADLRPLLPADTTAARSVRPQAGFHPADFALRHAPAAYGQTLECATCHSTEAFCRTCHQQAGLAPVVRAGPGFHGVGANWLLGHGQPARQGLESCASCHRQTDCVRCHSTVGAFHANPHGPSFDPARGWERSPGTCFACHVQKPTF